MNFVRVAWPYQARLRGRIMCGRPEKDDFVDSRGYPTVLAVGRDRFGGGTARQCRRSDRHGLVAVSRRCLYTRFDASLFARRGRSSGVGGYDVA